jgi:hypothetical protein
MNEQLRGEFHALIRRLRLRRAALRLELRDCPRWRVRYHRQLEVELQDTVDLLKGLLSMAGEPPTDSLPR